MTYHGVHWIIGKMWIYLLMHNPFLKSICCWLGIISIFITQPKNCFYCLSLFYKKHAQFARINGWHILPHSSCTQLQAELFQHNIAFSISYIFKVKYPWNQNQKKDFCTVECHVSQYRSEMGCRLRFISTCSKLKLFLYSFLL